MNKHEWRERTEDGELRKVRALHHGGRWRLQARLASEDSWTDLDPPSRDDLDALRDVLWGKYKRGRLPHRQIEEVDALLEAAGPPDAEDGAVRSDRDRNGH